MESSPLERHAENPMSAWDKVQRISEPWYITKVAVLGGGFVFAMVLAYFAATGQLELLILVAVWVIACLIIVFVRDYWWAPALVISTLSMQTYAVGFRMSGLEVGMVILGLTFPVKIAMKTLWPARPKMEAGVTYWALLVFLIAHAIVIYFYSKIDGAPQIKNIVRAYYNVIAPLVLYGMMVRYCNPKTVFRTCVILFAIWIVTTIIALIVYLSGIGFDEMTALRISVDFLSPVMAMGFLRVSGPALFISAIAFWPVTRSTALHALLVFAGVLGIVGVLFSSGRVPSASCAVAAFFFAVVRRRLWLALPIIVLVAVTSGVCTLKPDLLYSLPEEIQRSLTPLNFSDQKTEVQSDTDLSDEWHQRLRSESLTYWNMDTTSFFLGHGYKSWDDSIIYAGQGINVSFDELKTYAIEMGITENMFSSITNIFGLSGLVLYGAFLIHMAWRLWKGRMLSPDRSPERAICEVSFVNLVTAVAVAALAGGAPNIAIIYWGLGIFAARPYIGIPEEAEPVAAPAFDRSREKLSPKGGSIGADPLAAFAKRHARFRMSSTGPGGA